MLPTHQEPPHAQSPVIDTGEARYSAVGCSRSARLSIERCRKSVSFISLRLSAGDVPAGGYMDGSVGGYREVVGTLPMPDAAMMGSAALEVGLEKGVWRCPKEVRSRWCRFW
uniref:Uncharacterized protein n=1 Tax=Prymnesium polylepis TaxID=72548 RepID=A0A7S4HFV0_9EUKA|mmetsp:Transcript_37014/g.98108  ORF Transcript_37014/g.98108 Transcript_37014/m.98108 type:complete len:112 (+) Transcript_37014:140-475(+)